LTGIQKRAALLFIKRQICDFGYRPDGEFWI
jgi:hypothetical protein